MVENIQKSVSSLKGLYKESADKTNSQVIELEKRIKAEEEQLEKTFKSIPSLEGKTGKEVGTAYQSILKKIEQTRPMETRLSAQKKSIDVLLTERKTMIAELTDLRTQRSTGFQQSIKSLNKRLDGKLRIKMESEGNRKPLKQYLSNLNLDGIGEKRLQWIDSAMGLSPLALARAIEKGKDELVKSDWGIISMMADALLRLTPAQLRGLEAIDLSDLVNIELNISHQEEHYKNIEDLSTGQKCTAILHLLLLENRDPLLMDQPEDNLDNAFIAERIVKELRISKVKRQFLFATHNANIPVFGDAEWIGILESTKDGSSLPTERQGSIDSPAIRDGAASILEGGRVAFLQRKEKYGYQ
jgi:hypothetical protein